MKESAAFVLKVTYHTFWIGLNSFFIGGVLSTMGTDVDPIFNAVCAALLAVSLTALSISVYGLYLTLHKEY